MPTLLCTLGTSPFVVIEAFHFPLVDANEFSSVHILTSSSETTTGPLSKVKSWFMNHHPDTELVISRITGFSDLRNEQEQLLFDESAYRWFLDAEPDPHSRFVCLAGGFKTMSSTMQTAASFFGAAEVFHVLAPNNVCDETSFKTALAANEIHFIRLGSQVGWPQLASLTKNDYPLIHDTEQISISDNKLLRERVAEVLQAQRNVSGHFQEISSLPFPSLATLAPTHLATLRQPVTCTHANPRPWFRALPKIELHCHLGGFATNGEDLLAVRAAAADPAKLLPIKAMIVPEGWPRPSVPCGLENYMKMGDNNGSCLLKDLGCLRKQCKLLYQRLCEDGVVYAEIRCSPNNYSTSDTSAWEVLETIRSTFQNCMDESFQNATAHCHINLIIIATRKDAGDRSDISRHLALAVTAADRWRDPDSCRIVGVDLAGFENRETRAALFATDFEPVHRVGLAVTVHAGENDDAEGIWQAVFKLNARRLGHALHLKESPDLLRAVAERRIAVEMCPAANYQIKGFPLHSAKSKNYPLANYLEKRVLATINSDNLGISAMTLSENLHLATELCPSLTKMDFLQLQKNALDAAFLCANQKKALAISIEEKILKNCFSLCE